MMRHFPYAYVCSTGMSLTIRGHHFKTLGGYHLRYPNVILEKCPDMNIHGYLPYFPVTQNLVINECTKCWIEVKGKYRTKARLNMNLFWLFK